MEDNTVKNNNHVNENNTKDKKLVEKVAKTIKWCGSLVLVNILLWIVYVIFAILYDMKIESSLLEGIIFLIHTYVFYLNPIGLGIIYAIFEDKFSKKFELNKWIIRISTLIIWIVMNIVSATLAILCNDMEIIPSIDGEWSGMIYYVYMSILCLGFLNTAFWSILIIFIKNKIMGKDNSVSVEDIELKNNNKSDVM